METIINIFCKIQWGGGRNREAEDRNSRAEFVPRLLDSCQAEFVCTPLLLVIYYYY